MKCNTHLKSAIDSIENVISLSEMYHDIFSKQKKKKIAFENDRCKKNGRQIKYTYLFILLKCMHTFLALNVSLSMVMVMLLNRMPSPLCFHIII